MWRARFLAVVGLTLFVACGEDGGVVSGIVDSGDGAALDGIGGMDAPSLPDAAVDDSGDASAPVDSVTDVPAPDADSASEPDAAPVDCELTPGAFSCPCTDNQDCESGYCLDSVTGGVCTVTCVEECPAGWMCQSITQPPDIVYVCTPRADFLCEACSDDKECAGSKDLCIAQGAGSFCGISCDSNADCPAWAPRNSKRGATVPGRGGDGR